MAERHWEPSTEVTEFTIDTIFNSARHFPTRHCLVYVSVVHGKTDSYGIEFQGDSIGLVRVSSLELCACVTRGPANISEDQTALLNKSEDLKHGCFQATESWRFLWNWGRVGKVLCRQTVFTKHRIVWLSLGLFNNNSLLTIVY